MQIFPVSQVTKNRLQIVLVFAWLFLLVFPVLLYIYKFGWTVGADHSRWGEMGSAMSGIYSPLLALLALIVLIGQVRSQNGISSYQLDHAFVEQSRADLEFYLNKLDEALNATMFNGVSARELLQSKFCHKDIGAINSSENLDWSLQFNAANPRVFDAWSAVYPVLIGLQRPNKFPYIHSAISARQKCILIASFAGCVALDNLHYCLAEGRLRFVYFFSRDVPKEMQGD